MNTTLSPAEILARLPQQEPFRFIDEILSVDEDGIAARYTWRPDADFYRGHFPGNPITPGVLLIESMAQAAVVSHGIYLLSLEGGDPEKLMTVFTDAQIEFSGMVKPGDRVEIRGRKRFWRRRKLRSEAEMTLADGTLVCSGVVSGMGVAQ
ncbi:MAG: 3-hydroxyacyl-ACP dehydratase FabZ family protein [Myxococcota bacterium]|nr:3-hydroxyacyl-ACP dehydratase FabZ family protein [Myxococcota bacterium]